MPPIRKPRRRPLSFLDTRDRMSRLNALYRSQGFGGADKARSNLGKQLHQELDDMATPEPDEELTDSELSDSERQAAIARERMRREGYA
ncbi:MAG: hypothetical protein GEU75_06465 [Dehalococcoidia bacterium]|nr:hypothetical protein [Dehalococcoidia bacterium]